MSVDGINSNRHRVQTIFRRLDHAQDTQDIAYILKQLALDELISQQQYEKLAQLKEVDLSAIAAAIKDTKV